MALDMSIVKQRLEQKTQKGNGNTFEKTDWSKIFFKPKEGEQIIRIVPAKWNRDYPIKNVFFHDNNIFKRTVYALKNWGEKDPVEQFRKGLYEDAKSGSETALESENLAKKIKIKERFFMPVIVRGQEDKGVLLWEFGSQTETKILALLGKKKLGDITDVMEGRDLEVEGVKATMQQGAKNINYIEVNILPDSVTSPLSEDANLVKKWLDDQKDPLEVHKKYTFAEIKEMFAKYLDPEAAEAEKQPAPAPKPTSAAVKKFAPAPPEPEDDEDDVTDLVPDQPFEEDPEEEELPPPPPPVKKAAPKAPAKAPTVKSEVKVAPKAPSKAVSVADKFSAVFDDDE